LLRAEIKMGEEEKPRRVIGVLLDITDRRQAAERQQLLVNELNHRVKNMLTMVQSITHQTLKHASSLTTGQANIEARLAALARTHDLLTEQGYDSAPIGGIVHRSLSPFAIDRWRLFTQGPDTLLRPRQSLDLALVLHELATNAIKYGAWSNREGCVTATWTMDGNGSKQFLHFRWIETGGPPVEPTAHGVWLPSHQGSHEW
jgi:two-component sensor histidine kinase